MKRNFPNLQAFPTAYPYKPMHLQPVFNIKDASFFKGERPSGNGAVSRYPPRFTDCHVAEDFFSRGLCLPSGTAMSNTDLDRVIEVILICGKAAAS